MAITDLIPWRRPGSLATRADHPMVSLQREMNRMLEEAWSRGGRARAAGFMSFYPDVDIDETDEHIDLTAEVPGVDQDHIRVTLSGDGEMLTLEGEKRSEKERRSETAVHAERRFGRFRRTMTLPGRVDPDAIEARYKNGVLQVHMRKLAPEKQRLREIPIKAP